MSGPAAILQAVGSAFQAAGVYGQGLARNKALSFQARVLEYNKKLAHYQAQQLRKSGREAAQRHRINVEELVGKQRAAGAGSGVRVDAGSMRDITESTAILGEEDALDIEYNALQQAAGVDRQAISMGLQAGMLKASKGNPWFSAATSFLGGLF